MKLPSGWESFWEPAIPKVRKERVAYRKGDLIVRWWYGRWQVYRDGKVISPPFSDLREAIEFADAMRPEVVP